MALLFDMWFPDGDVPWGKVSALDANDVHYTEPDEADFQLADVAARCALTTAPNGSGETVCRFTKFAADPGISAGPKVQLAPPFTTEERDPISNWDGESSSRRWYRFKVCLAPDFVFEAPWGDPPGSQRLVLFQIHDTADTSPADYDTSPPLWLIIEPDGWFAFKNTSCGASQTTSSNFTVRTVCRVRLEPGIPAEFVLYARWAHDDTGELSIWQDRRLLYTETGVANCKDDDPARGGSGLFSLLCCYCLSDQIDRTVYHWGLQIGDESYADYAAFAAACGAGSELEQVIPEFVGGVA